MKSDKVMSQIYVATFLAEPIYTRSFNKPPPYRNKNSPYLGGGLLTRDLKSQKVSYLGGGLFTRGFLLNDRVYQFLNFSPYKTSQILIEGQQVLINI